MNWIDRLKVTSVIRLGTLALSLGVTASIYAQDSDQSDQPAGRVERVEVHGVSLEGNLMGEPASPYVSIYLPPSYNEAPDQRYPVIYLLHSYTGTDLAYFGPRGARAQLLADRIYNTGAAREMIIVMPNCLNAYGGCMYSNSVTAGNWQGFIADDLVAYIDDNYRTLARRESLDATTSMRRRGLKRLLAGTFWNGRNPFSSLVSCRRSSSNFPNSDV